MKRDLTLIRDLLLEMENAESNIGFDVHQKVVRFSISQKEYSPDLVDYHLKLLIDAELVKAERKSTQWDAKRLTWKGHEYLDLIREDKKLALAKEIMLKFGIQSIEVVFNVLSKCLEKAILEVVCSNLLVPHP